MLVVGVWYLVGNGFISFSSSDRLLRLSTPTASANIIGADGAATATPVTQPNVEIITDTPAPEPMSTPLPDAVVNTNSERLIMRSGPGTEYEIKGRYANGTPLGLLGRDDSASWLYVAAPDEQTGWVAQEWVIVYRSMTDIPVLAAPPPPAASLGNGLRGLIAFASNRVGDGGSHIFTMQPDGSDQRQLTSDPVFNLFPDWSPAGDRLVYVRGSNPGCSTDPPAGDLIIMQPDGSDKRQLTNGLCARWPRWSPDGQWIVYADHSNGPGTDSDRYDLYVVSVDGSEIKHVTSNPGFDGFPSWTPDGQVIYTREPAGGGKGDIYVTDVDGPRLWALTAQAGENWYPIYSRDGSRIAFASNRDGPWNIYTMNSSGTAVQRVTSGQGIDKYPAWSPDDEWIAFHSNMDGPDNYELYLAPARGGDITRLTFQDNYDDEPSWSP